MAPYRLLLTLFLASLTVNLILAISQADWFVIPAMLAGWYFADLLSGLIHMYMDYRACPPGRDLGTIFHYPGSRESPEYLALFRERMSRLTAFERVAYDFKNHHPRPDALGRRPVWRLIGTTVLVAALPASLILNALALLLPQMGWNVPAWAMAGCVAFLVGGAFAQYFHSTLHRTKPPAVVSVLRQVGLLMSPVAHQLHHDTLQRDFATNCGWSNPLVNALFKVLRKRGKLPDENLEPSS